MNPEFYKNNTKWAVVALTIAVLLFVFMPRGDVHEITLTMEKPYQSSDWKFEHCTSNSKNCGLLE